MKKSSRGFWPALPFINKNIYLRIPVMLILFGMLSGNASAQLSLTNVAPSATIDFSNSMPTTVGTNPSTAYTGAGFQSNPTIAGRLNSNAWAVEGWSDPNINFAGSGTTGDPARGVSAGPTGVTTGGFYAYTGTPATAANPTFLLQPGGGDFAPGSLTLRLINNGTTIITSLNISYNIFFRNDQSRSSSFNFSYSSDNFVNSDVAVPALDYTTIIAPDAGAWTQVGTSPSRSATLTTGVYIPPGTYFYLRWASADVAGSGSRDEIGLDDINITATYSGPCTPPTTQAVVNSFSNVLSSQMDVNFTRGNGTGGVLMIASTSPTLSSDPVSGINYTANTNFGNGDAVGGGYVLYSGVANGISTAATVSVTGLPPSTTIYFFLFEYAVTVPCYLIPGNTGSQGTAIGSATLPTDYFRSRITGNWNNSNTWESSTDNLTWILATSKPTFQASGILIQSPHIVTVTGNETARLLNIAVGATLTYSNTAGGGYDVDVADDGSVTLDLQVNGTLEIFGKAPSLLSGATARVFGGGLVKASANVGGTNTSDDFARYTSVSWSTNAIFEWATATSFQTTSAVYFPNALVSEIAIFRVSVATAPVGASTTTNIQGRLEVNGNISWQNTGSKIFRNGIIGTATLTQVAGCGPFIIDGTGILSGTGAINLSNTGSLVIATTSVTALNSNKTINTVGGTFTVDGRLNCAAFIVGGTCTFSLSAAATLGIGSADGIVSLASGALGNIQVTNGRVYNTAANYIYNGVVNQVTGNGLPLTIVTGGTLSISNGGGAGNNTVTLTTNNTTTPVLNLVNGLFEAGTGQFLRITATGAVNGSGGNQGQSAAAGTIWFIGGGTVTPGASLSLTNVRVTAGVSMGGGNTTIKGILEIANTGFVNTGTAPTYSSSPASTLLYTCGCNYGVGEEWYQNTFGTVAGVPHNVTLLAGTSLNFGATNFTHEMRGDLTINNTSTFALSTVFGGDLNIKGNWTRTSTGVFTHNTRSVRFNGTSGTQTITRTGGGTETFAYLFIDKAAGQAVKLTTAPDATNVAVTGFGGNNILQLINGDLDLNQQTLSFTNYLTTQNNLGIDGTAGNLTRNIINTGTTTGTFAVANSDAVTHAITINRMTGNASLLVFGTNVTLTTTGAGPGGGGINFGNTLTTVNGTLQLNAYGYVTGFAPTYGNNSFLVYNSGGTFDRNVEWGSLAGPGYPWNVVVQNGTNIRLNTPAINGDADRAIAGNLSIVSGSSLLLSTTAANKLTVGGNLQLDGTLTLPTVVGGDLYIGGNWNRPASGVFTANDRAVFFNGATNSTITASGGQLFPYLYLTKSLLSQTLSLLDDIRISKEFKVTTGTFDLAGKNATLLSDASGTASFGKVGLLGDVTYSGAGRFIVERYIPTGVLAGQHIKSWQFLAVPDNGGQTINAGWQEGNVLPAIGTSGLGTIITNNIAGAGFDIIGGSGPSLKTYVPASATWVGVPNTAGTALHNQKGYFILVRGDRNVSAYNAPATSTTLRSTGKLFVPSSNLPPVTNVPAGRFESIGNPYASAIDFLNITKPAAPLVDDVFYVWDPLLPGTYNLGGFQTISSSNGYKPNPGGTINYSSATAYTKIQSGQAFMVHATGAGGNVSFTENAKISGSDMVYRPAPAISGNRQYFRATLYTASGVIADGNVLAFDPAFNNAYETADALKILNAGENFGISSNDKTLTIEAKRPVTRTDTIHYFLSNLRTQAYQFRFGAEDMAGTGITAFLEDRFLGTRTFINLLDSSFVDFNISSDPASAAADRFMLVFVKNTRTVNNGPLITVDNKKEDSKDAVSASKSMESISVYPNPVVNGLIQLNFRNKTAGRYSLQLISSAGQVVFQTSVSISGKEVNRQVQPGAVAAGYYRLKIISEEGETVVLQVVM